MFIVLIQGNSRKRFGRCRLHCLLPDTTINLSLCTQTNETISPESFREFPCALACLFLSWILEVWISSSHIKPNNRIVRGKLGNTQRKIQYLVDLTAKTVVPFCQYWFVFLNLKKKERGNFSDQLPSTYLFLNTFYEKINLFSYRELFQKNRFSL